LIDNNPALWKIDPVPRSKYSKILSLFQRGRVIFIPYSSVREAKSILFVCKIQIYTLMFKQRVIGIVKQLVTANLT